MAGTLSFARDERGASMIELALALPILSMMAVGMVDISQGYSAKVKLVQAAQRSIEKAMQSEQTSSLYDNLQAEAAKAASVPLKQVTVKYWLECNGVDQSTGRESTAEDFNKNCATGEMPARYVDVEIEKRYVPMFATKWLGSNGDGSFTLHGKAALRVQ